MWLIVLMLTLAQTPRTPEVIAADLDKLAAEVRLLKAPTIATTADLQTALLQGGEITLAPGATYTGAFVVRSGTTIHGQGAILTSDLNLPALTIPPGVNDVTVEDVTFTAPQYTQRVVLVGTNDAQQITVAQVPKRIVLRRVSVPTFRGKRAYDLNGEVTLDHSSGGDVYDPGGQDSQVIYISPNSTGNVVIDGGSYSGASETLLIGGDVPRIPGNVPTNIVIREVRFWRPLAEQHDGISRKTKTLLEIKGATDVWVQRSTFDGSWKDAQDGWAWTVTPRNGSVTRRIVFEDLLATNVAGGFNIMGFDNATVTPQATGGIVIRRVTVVASVAAYGGRGEFALLTTGVQDVTIEGCTFTTDGTKFIEYGFGTALQSDGTKRLTDKLGVLSVTGSRFVAGAYSFSLAGQQNATSWATSVTTLIVEGNTIADAASALKKNLPQNTFIDRATLEALIVR